MSYVTVKVEEWVKLFEEHPRCVDVLYAGMPNQETFSLVMREYRI